jgi:predicted dehydrogenase
MAKVMRLGIVGCGLIGGKRAEAARRSGHVIAAVADVDPARAQGLGRSSRATIVSQDWREVVGADVDIVAVSTTHDQLAPICLAAVSAGKHVLVEKPAARTAAELAQVIAAAERSGVLVKVGFNHRFHPALEKARAIVDSGALGPLLYVRGRYGHGGRRGYEQEWRCKVEISGGGELIDQGSHLIDLSRWFLGDFQQVEGHITTQFWNVEVEDNCFLSLRTAAGQTAWLHASWTEWKNLFCFEIFGRDGKLQVDGLGGSYGVERLTHYKMSKAMGPPATTSWEYPCADQSWDLEFADFIDAIDKRRRPSGDIYDAKATLDVIAIIYGRRS